jgi:DNA polymerase-3 subunit beta
MLSLAGEVIKTRTPKPALLGVLLKAEPDLFSAHATDLETWVSQTTKVVQVDRAGVALVSAERLQDVVKAMADDAVSLEAGEDLLLHVRGAKTHFKLLAMKPTDFPPLPVPDEATPVTVKATDLREMVNQTAFAAAKENGQHAKAAVLFRISNGKLERVATRASRPAMVRAAASSGGWRSSRRSRAKSGACCPTRKNATRCPTSGACAPSSAAPGPARCGGSGRS